MKPKMECALDLQLVIQGLARRYLVAKVDRRHIPVFARLYSALITCYLHKAVNNSKYDQVASDNIE